VQSRVFIECAPGARSKGAPAPPAPRGPRHTSAPGSAPHPRPVAGAGRIIMSWEVLLEAAKFVELQEEQERLRARARGE
jgi:hypothetical protein